ncbi:MAG: YjjG family noncanonical pyrimidine nucleotidase [Clostridia bacterium]|nr:YjjG family noncanonical pyrimidine nucleotidase [Clostridia bacterium]
MLEIRKYECILLDSDDTLLNFYSAQVNAIRKTLEHLGIVPTTSLERLYDGINRAAWVEFENGLLSKEEVLTVRFDRLFDALGIKANSLQIESFYMRNLEEGHRLNSHSKEVCERLSKYFRLFIITNGVSRTQKIRLGSCGILKYIEKVFISEDCGISKPHKEYFDIVLNDIRCSRSNALVVGDSLTSDILGANNSDLDSVWYNPKKKTLTGAAMPTYTISDLRELYDIVGG